MTEWWKGRNGNFYQIVYVANICHRLCPYSCPIKLHTRGVKFKLFTNDSYYGKFKKLNKSLAADLLHNKCM